MLSLSHTLNRIQVIFIPITVTTVLVVLSGNARGTADFSEVPHSVSVNAGVIAEFKCQHPRAMFIRWKINEELLREPYPPGITTPNFGILHILGHPVYNGTLIACIAFTPFSVVSPNVTLTVYEGFVQLPISTNLTIHQEAMFTCELKNIGVIIWTINNISHIDDLPPNTTVHNDGSTSVLRFSSCINNTVIECRAVYPSARNLPEISPSVSMKCQGLLGAIHNFVASGDSITWEAPFSLDLTNVGIDILYCLNIYNITCGGRILKTSDCSINETHYTISPDMDYIFEMTIFARSNVPRSGNGTSFPRRAEVVNGNLTGLTVVMLTSMEVAIGLTLNLVEKTSPFEVSPAFYSLSANPIDNVDHTTLNCSTTADTSTGTMISLSAACPFPVDRLYRVQVWAFGCYKHLVGNSVLLSTHRVQITSIQPLRMGGVQIIGKFLNNSETTGFLAVFYSATDKDVVYYYPVFKPPNQLKFKHVFGDHLSGRFAISIFVIDENSLPLSRAISTPRIVKVKAAQDPGIKERVSIEYSVTENSIGVGVTCKSINTSRLTGCLVLIHQRISQLDSSGLVSITSFNIQNRSGDTAYRFFPGIDLQHYHVGVAEGKMIMQPYAIEPGSDDKETTPGLIVTSVCIVPVIGIFSFAVVLIMWYLLYWRTNQKITALFSEGRIHFSHLLPHDITMNTEDDSAGFGQQFESVTPIIEQHLSHLLPHASKWFDLGKALSVEEDHLKKIYDNNERDENSLRELLELYMASIGLNPSLEKIDTALKGIKSGTTAIQPTTQDYLGQPAVIIHNTKTTFIAQKHSDQYVDGRHVKEHKIHDQCQDDLKTDNSSEIEASNASEVSKVVVGNRERPYRPSGNRANRRYLLELHVPLETHPQDDADTTFKSFPGRAGGDQTPP